MRRVPRAMPPMIALPGRRRRTTRGQGPVRIARTRQDTVRIARRRVRAPSGPAAWPVPAPSVARRCGRRRVVRRMRSRVFPAVVDLVFLLLTLAVFGLLALLGRGGGGLAGR